MIRATIDQATNTAEFTKGHTTIRIYEGLGPERGKFYLDGGPGIWESESSFEAACLRAVRYLF